MVRPGIALAMLEYFAIIFLSCSCYSVGFRFDGFAVIELTPRTLHQIKTLWKFSFKFGNDDHNFTFLQQYPYKENITIAALVSPFMRQTLEECLKEESIPHRIIIENYQLLIDQEMSGNREAMFRSFFRSKVSTDHEAYLQYDQMERWIIRKVHKVQFAKFTKFGDTFEGRKLFKIKISKNSSLPTVWIDGGIHAREWISTSSVLVVMDKLLQNTPEAIGALSKFQFVIVPLVNPDGYEYSHLTYRLWRKNRAIFRFSRCVGVDLNRNYPYEWGGNGSTPYSCDEIYRGPSASSEKETQAMIKEMTEIKDSLKLVISVHSYGPYIIQPFHFNADAFSNNHLEMLSIAMRTASVIHAKHGTAYRIGRAPDVLYIASGTSDDFAVGTLKIPYSFTIELPDKENHFFSQPPRLIKIIGEEFWDIVQSLILEVCKTWSC